MIIWLASYPRSGNTFFRLLVKHKYALPTYSIYQLQNSNKISNNVGETIGISTPFSMSLDEMATSDTYYFVKTHDLPKEDFPAIYLVRDGRDSLVSYAHYTLDYDLSVSKAEHAERYYEILRMLIETEVHFGNWSRNIHEWTHRSTPTVFVKYEKLITNPVACCQSAMAHVGYQAPEINQNSVPTFSDLHQQVPDFFRKGKVGSWREEMPEDLHQRFWERHGEIMYKMGYSEA